VGQVNLTWTAVPLPPGGEYLIYWAQGTALGLGQVQEPIVVDRNQEDVTLDLEPGFVYYFVLQTRDDNARLSHPSNWTFLLLSDGVDNDDDGLPDDWEAAYEVFAPQFDPDGDGLSNADELQAFTDPRRFDTDGDGYSDGAEVIAGGDPIDLSITPNPYEAINAGTLPLPILFADKDRLVFYAYTELGTPSAQTIGVYNIGSGTLNLDISDDAGWLTTSLNEETLTVNVDTTGLSNGAYLATIRIAGEPDSYTQNSPQWIPVILWVFEGEQPANGRLFLPAIMR
jgi:hypothetical protein